VQRKAKFRPGHGHVQVVLRFFIDDTEYIGISSEHPKPFVWTKTADEILGASSDPVHGSQTHEARTIQLADGWSRLQTRGGAEMQT